MDDAVQDCDVVVVGGGPAGAAAAAHLAAQGFATIVVDRANFPRDKACGDFVGPAALTELADLGVTDTEGFGATNIIRAFALHVDGSQAGALPIPQVDGLPAYGRVIPRQQLDAWVLAAARAAGATVFEGRKVTEVCPGRDTLTVQGQSADGPWQLRTRLLIGADGSSSLVARMLRGSAPSQPDRIFAVRANLDGVSGAADQADICLSRETFPGYSWVFPSGDGQANVGVGMVASTYPPTSHNLRALLLRVIDEDPSMQRRLGGAPIRGRIIGWPLTTYNPRLPLVGDRMMLVGDAAGLINPLNGEGIQYALVSGRWAAEVAADRLTSGQLDATSLAGYEQCVHRNLHRDMAFSRLIVELFRNRALNPIWLRTLRSVAARASIDADYAYRVGCVLIDLPPATRALGLSVALKTVKQATRSPRAGVSSSRSIGRHRHRPRNASCHEIASLTRPVPNPGELVGWAAGVGQAFAELTTPPIYKRDTVLDR
jgi:geranylgeranyl reductase family protein